MRFPILSRLLVASALWLGAQPALAFTDPELIDAFNRTVFGTEYGSMRWQAGIVKKYTRPVRFYIEDRSGTGRGPEAARFIRTLPRKIHGLQASIVGRPGQANFRIFIINRAEYRELVSSEIYRNRSASFAPGKCLVRVISNRNGITRSDAVIVADEGDFLFERCLIEETLQGLGPVNDDQSLSASVFNDRSRHSEFTAHDRYIMNMLYDPRIRPGMKPEQVAPLLPQVLASVRRRLDGR